MEDIRPDEEAVLKTAGVNTLRGSSPWSSALFEIVLWPSGEGNCPVFRKHWHPVATNEYVGARGSSPSRTTHLNGATPLGAGHVCKTCCPEFESLIAANSKRVPGYKQPATE